MVLGFLVKPVPVGAEGDVEDLDEHVVQVLAVERVQQRPVKMSCRVVEVFRRSDEDSGRLGEIPRRRRVDDRAPLEVRLQGVVLSRNDELFGLENN